MPVDGSVSVEVVLNQIVASQQLIQSDISQMRSDVTKALTHLEVVDQRNVSADRYHADVEARLRMLEKFRFTLMGMASIGGVASGILGYWIAHIFH